MSTDSLHSDLLIGEVSRCGKLGVPNTCIWSEILKKAEVMQELCLSDGKHTELFR